MRSVKYLGDAATKTVLGFDKAKIGDKPENLTEIIYHSNCYMIDEKDMLFCDLRNEFHYHNNQFVTFAPFIPIFHSENGIFVVLVYTDASVT